jgi:hypothetical protein
VMEGGVNWTILIGNRGAAHGSLQATQPAIRRIVACLPQHHSELAGLAIKTWSAGTEPSPKTLGASGCYGTPTGALTEPRVAAYAAFPILAKIGRKARTWSKRARFELYSGRPAKQCSLSVLFPGTREAPTFPRFRPATPGLWSAILRILSVDRARLRGTGPIAGGGNPAAQQSNR